MKNPFIDQRRSAKRAGRRGFTLTELAIVLGIAGIVFAGIWAAAAAVSENNRINEAVQDLQTISGNMDTLYESHKLPCAASVMTSNAVSAGVIPSSMLIGAAGAACTAGGVQQPWSTASGDFAIYSDLLGAATQNFRVSFYNVPLGGCVSFLMQETNCDPHQPGCPIAVMTNDDAAPANYLGISGTPLVASSYPATGWQGVLTVTKAEALCSANALPFSAGANSVEFDFKL
jgi:prepilin-type N-terminal cleavage/methylation domain-containing protein